MTEPEAVPKAGPRLPVRALITFAVFILILPGVIFLAAGTFQWIAGWVYYGITVTAALLSRLLVMRKQPDLLGERARSQRAEDVKPWDRSLSLLVGLVAPTITLIVAGLDKRFSWSPPLPVWVAPVSVVFFVLGYAFATWAMLTNRFFSAVVRIQKERDHRVVRDGPYRIVRHPGYVGGAVSAVATPLLLGSVWALIPAAVYVVLICVRTALEDRTLQEELPGYREYAQQTRYRLVPGVW